MVKIRLVLILLTFLVVGSVGYFVSLYARGYKLDLKTFKFTPSGILAVKSDPDGAQIFINGDFKGATNTNISLSPGNYDVAIKKDGYITWNKRVTIEKEVVTTVSAGLFRSTPALSPDLTKIVYATNFSPDPANAAKNGLWLMETISLPFGFGHDPRRITDGDQTGNSWQFSPDGRQILLSTQAGAYLLDNSTFTPETQLVNIAAKKLQTIADWQNEKKVRLNAEIKNLPPEVVDLLSRKTSAVSFSLDGNKILYTASASATLPNNLIKPLPGSSTQKQERDIKPGKTYVYDIKEDRNFLIDDNDTPPNIDSDPATASSERRLFWLANSDNLVLTEPGKISVMDYDGTNRQDIFSGSYEAPFAFPFGSSGKILILTNLGSDSATPNLYYLSLK
jgi:hypothetical protein